MASTSTRVSNKLALPLTRLMYVFDVSQACYQTPPLRDIQQYCENTVCIATLANHIFYAIILYYECLLSIDLKY